MRLAANVNSSIISEIVNVICGRDGTAWTRRLGHSPIGIVRSSLCLIVVDDSKGNPDRSLETIWTTYPNVRVESGNTPGLYNLSADRVTERLKAYFLGRPSMTVEAFRGSRTPFAGWTAPEGKPEPAGAVVTNQPADDAWAVTAWILNGGTKQSG